MNKLSLLSKLAITGAFSASAVFFTTLVNAQSTYIAQPGFGFNSIEFDDGGELLSGASWLQLFNGDGNVVILNYNLITTDGFEVPGFTYTPDNSNGSVLNIDFDNDGNISFLDAQFIGEEQILEFFTLEGVSETTSIDLSRIASLFILFVPADESNPILPGETLIGGGFRFVEVPSGNWFDPPATSGFTYTMETPGSFFTEILGFPSGFNNPFSVLVDGENKGSFTPGENYTFDPGVTSFSITGIDPLVDGQDPLAFPIQLSFNTNTATFTQIPIEASTSVPEPSTIIGLGILATFGFGTSFKRKLVKAKKK
ncbi:MAG: PEP-CTERM sorting domain-containing protein [Crocosphaera sp.]